MRPKAHILLAAGILTLLCLPAPACSHDDGAKSGGEVDWRTAHFGSAAGGNGLEHR